VLIDSTVIVVACCNWFGRAVLWNYDIFCTITN